MTAGTPVLPRASASQPTSERWRELRSISRGDAVYRVVLTLLAATLPFLLLVILGELIVGAWPAMKTFGLGFFVNSVWDPVAGKFGALPLIFGTIYSSLVALVIAVPLALGCRDLPHRSSRRAGSAPRWPRWVELLAGVPSVIYGLWGIFVLIPLLRDVIWPVFGRSSASCRCSAAPSTARRCSPVGPSWRSCACRTSPRSRAKCCSLSQPRSAKPPWRLGATRWEAVWTVVLPYGRAGIFGAIVLGLGRALGETMAVTMLIGNRHEVSFSLTQPGLHHRRCHRQ